MRKREGGHVDDMGSSSRRLREGFLQICLIKISKGGRNIVGLVHLDVWLVLNSEHTFLAPLCCVR